VIGEVLRGFGIGPVGDNPGIDIGAAVGTDVAAVGAGEVTYAGKPAPAYGTIVIVGHSGGVFTVYSKLSEASVHKGDRVVSGQVLGRVARGGGSGPSHLHFEVRRDQQAVDPLLFLPPR
jgi:murein DD-endopeptidase MepM/ murein hydrolase activator NlpD